MILSLKKPYTRITAAIIPGTIAVTYFLAAVFELQDYIPWASVNFIIGLIGLPVIILYSPARRRSARFLFLSLAFSLLAFFVPENAVLFMAFGCAMIGILECMTGKLSLPAFATLGMMTPTIQYIAGAYSFPIRLKLTAVTGKLMAIAGAATTTSGNIITFRGHDYSVDPACMGLKMLLTSFLCGLFIIAVLQRKQEKYIKGRWVFFSLTLIFLFNLLCNMARIAMLVYFDLKPGTIMHELTGLVCLAIYVLLPSVMIIKLIINRFGKPLLQQTAKGKAITPANRYLFMHGINIALLIASGILISYNNRNSSPVQPPAVSGFSASCYDKEVIQYKSANALVYIKKIKGVLYGEHNPVICWLGSGYEFESIGEEEVNGVRLYMGTLKKGNAALYTAWWYDNGKSRTTGQLDWRWKVLKGEKQYAIINITCGDKATLIKEVMEINDGNIFRNAL